MGFKVLIVEDEVSINDILVSALRADGYIAKGVFLGKDAQDALEIFHPDLILLDINLPDENGFELCRYINNKYCIPIIMLTARNDIVDKVLGLELGADDYITKPFNIKEVLTRVKVAIRRVNKYKEKSEEEFIYINKFVKVNLEGRIVFKDDEEVKLKPQEYELLEFFIKNRNIVFSREILLNKVWDLIMRVRLEQWMFMLED